MKSIKITSLLCGSVLSLAATNALAQQSSTTQPGSPSSSSPQSSQSQSSQLPQSSQPSQYGTSGQDQTTSQSRLGSTSALQSDNTVRLSQLMNSSVQSKDGKTLGNIRDLTVDPQSGRIEFAILSMSSAGAATDTSAAGQTVPSSRSSNIGTSGVAAGSTTGKLIPVPWQLFSHSAAGSRLGSSATATTGIGSSAMGSKTLVLDIDESKLQSAPSFDASNWNQMQMGSLDQRVYSHFGVDRTSATGTPGATIRGEGTSGATDPSSIRSPGSSRLPDSSQTPSSTRSPGSSQLPSSQTPSSQTPSTTEPDSTSPDR